MRRRLLVCALATLACLGLVLGLLAAWVQSDDAHARFEALASQALDREVRVGAIDVGLDAITLRELTISDPWARTPSVSADRAQFEVRWQALLDGGLAGTLRADRFSLDVRKRGTETNFHGIRRARSRRRPLDLLLVLGGGTVRVHDEDRGETVTAEGVTLSGRVQRSDAQPRVALDVGARTVRARGIAVFDVDVGLRVDAEAAELETLSVRLGDGVLQGRARAAFELASGWSVELEAHDVALSQELLPLVAAAFPAAAGVQERPEGALSMTVVARGAGWSRAQVLQSLQGRVELTLHDVVLPRASALVRVGALLGRGSEPLALPVVEVEARVQGPWVSVQRVRTDGTAVAVPFEGRVALDGRIEGELDVMPLLQVMPGVHERVRRYTTRLPVRVSGTTEQPSISMPPMAEVMRGAADAWFERASVSFAF